MLYVIKKKNSSDHEKFPPFELNTLEHKSSCNPKVVWEEGQCWRLVRIASKPKFPLPCGHLLYIIAYWAIASQIEALVLLRNLKTVTLICVLCTSVHLFFVFNCVCWIV